MSAPQKIRTTSLTRMKQAGEKIVVVTAYDAITAQWVGAAEIDVILVGDSLGNTALGFENTIPVTLDMMVHHCAAVSRAGGNALLVGDLPFMTYKISPEQAMASAARLMQEGGMEAVKLEGGGEIAPMVRRLTEAGIPFMGHLGLLPQSVHQSGGYRTQGTDAVSAEKMLADARLLEESGAFALVLEKVPEKLARDIRAALKIPTIGIGAGPECDGQVLVLSDLLGMGIRPFPHFAKQYASLHSISVESLKQYSAEVKAKQFPLGADEHEQ